MRAAEAVSIVSRGDSGQIVAMLGSAQALGAVIEWRRTVKGREARYLVRSASGQIWSMSPAQVDSFLVGVASGFKAAETLSEPAADQIRAVQIRHNATRKGTHR